MNTDSSDISRRAWVATLAGTLISVVLFVLVYSARNPFLFWPQALGLYICTLIRGVHSATKSDYAVIAIPINAAFYAVVIFGLLRGFSGNELQFDLPDH